MIGETLSHYKILAQIGSGGMGAVFKAEDTKLRREVALKILPDDLAGNIDRLDRFQREARAVAALNHPNIVTLFSVEEHSGRHFITMELVKGQPLDRVMPRNGFSTKEFLELAVPMADAVAAAHQQGITHRDLKPGNIMIDASGRVKVIDFGLAKAAAPEISTGTQAGEATEAVTMEGRVLGTPAYMSPEQVEGKAVDHRSDIFALGILFHEMLTGDRPFHGGSNMLVMSAILKDDPKSVSSLRPEVPPEISRLVRRCLQKKPSDRVQSALDLRNELRELQQELISGTLSSIHAPPVRRTKNPVPMILAGVAALALAAALYWKFSAKAPAAAAAPGAAPAAQASASTAVDPNLPSGIPAISRLATTDRLEAMPAFSPDGRHVAFVAAVDKFRQIFVRDIGSSQAVQITRGNRDHILPAWGPDTNTLFFAESMQEGVNLTTGDSSDGVYHGVDSQIVRHRFSDGDRMIIVRSATYPTVAPGGDRLFFAGQHRIHMSALNGTRVVQLSSDEEEKTYHAEPRVSFDGSRVVYRRSVVREELHQIAIVTTNHQVSLVKTNGRNFTPTWHPSGKFVYFSMYRGSGKNIWRLPIGPDNRAAGSPEAVTVGAGSDIEPAFSPDGWRMAFSVSSVNADIYGVAIDPVTGKTNGSPAVPMPFSSNREDSRAFWAPSTNELMMSFNSDRDGDMNIYIWRQRDNSITRVTSGPGGDYQATWSPDLQKLTFFSSRSGNAEIYVVATNANSTPVRITQNPGLDYNPFFSPDGTRIAYQSEREGRVTVHVMNVDGSNDRKVSPDAATSHYLPWLDAKSILALSRSAPQNDPSSYHTFSVEDGTQKKVTSLTPFPEVGGHGSFSPDRTRLMDLDYPHSIIWVVSLVANEGYPIFAKPDPNATIDYPCWSPDGRLATFDYALPRQSELLLAEWQRP